MGSLRGQNRNTRDNKNKIRCRKTFHLTAATGFRHPMLEFRLCRGWRLRIEITIDIYLRVEGVRMKEGRKEERIEVAKRLGSPRVTTRHGRPLSAGPFSSDTVI